jgi:bifunctional DNA-binding transcriptional regulator/antitoxin component of YhaV-PrlF toxin-antitoxin module
MSQTSRPDAGESEVEANLFGISKVQRSGGSFTATIPADAAEELGIEKGDRVVFRSGGRGEIVVEEASELF